MMDIFNVHSDDVDDLIDHIKEHTGLKVITINLFKRDYVILDKLVNNKIIVSKSDFIRQAIAEKLTREMEILTYYQDWDAFTNKIPVMEQNLREEFRDFYNLTILEYKTFSFHQIVQQYLDLHHVPKMHRVRYYRLFRSMNVYLIHQGLKSGQIQKTDLGSKTLPIYQYCG